MTSQYKNKWEGRRRRAPVLQPNLNSRAFVVGRINISDETPV